MSHSPENAYLLESGKPLSESLLWQLQYDYYLQQGINAWGQGQTPSYITSNAYIARQYAEIVFGLFRDLHQHNPVSERIYLLEPGAGSGQFAYLFVLNLRKLCHRAAFPTPEFCYVISDFAESNVAFWESHPKLQVLANSGHVDFAVFDAATDDRLHLRRSGIELRTGSLSSPLIVLANYFFDSIPQDLFFVHPYALSEARPNLYVPGPQPSKSPARLLKSIEMDFDLHATDLAHYPEPIFNAMLAAYQQALPDCWLLFPAPALRMLERLRAWTSAALFLLTGDKGVQNLAELRGLEQPELIVHGGFSLTVNYHAFHQYVQQCGGLSLMPSHVNYHLNVHGFLFHDDGKPFQELKNVFADTVEGLGPDDFFHLKKVMEKRMSKMKWSQLMATLRHSHYDSKVFQNMVPRLHELLTGLLATERRDILLAAERVWENYYPISSGENLANDLAQLAFALDDFSGALRYFEYAMHNRPQSPDLYFKAALCYDQLEDYTAAEKYLRLVVQMDSEHAEAAELLADYATSPNHPSI